MANLRTPTKTLGPISAKLIMQLQKSDKTIFTTDDARQIYGKDKFATGDLLSELAKRGILARIKAGVYLILQTGTESTQLRNWPIIGREIVAPHPYFISHYSAMRLHGMTSHPIFDIYITTPVRRPDKKISDLNYHFIYSKKEHFWGVMDHWATKQERVRVSDLERTILDGLDRSDLCGGLTDVIRGIWAKQKEINYKKLIQYAKKFRTKAAVKRLGFTLETLGIGEETITAQILNQIKNSTGYVLLDPNGSKGGTYLNRWWLRLNTNIAELKTGVWG